MIGVNNTEVGRLSFPVGSLCPARRQISSSIFLSQLNFQFLLGLA